MAYYSSLKNLLIDDIECFVFDSIDSTNNYLSCLPYTVKTQVCISKEQTNGKGQHGRKWVSGDNGSITFSMRVACGANKSISGLSLVVGLALVNVLASEYGANKLKIKWPNDIYFENKKLAGILIENQINADLQYTVIGVGLNVNLGRDFQCQTPWTDLKNILTRVPNNIELSAKVINNICLYYKIFLSQGMAYFQQQWQQYDYLYDKNITFIDNNAHTKAICAGISDNGALLLSINNKLIEVYSSRQIKL